MYRNENAIRSYSEPLKLKNLAQFSIRKHTKSKLMKSLNQEFIKTNINVGSDTLFKVLKKFKT
jgi:hypothetical protein